jgi:thiol-disulfide isomerase/thioredoxin
MIDRWCGPCKILGPRLEKAVGKQKGRVAMAKVDIDDHTDLAIEYGVREPVLWDASPSHPDGEPDESKSSGYIYSGLPQTWPGSGQSQPFI